MEDDYDYAAEDFYERTDRELGDIVAEFRAGRKRVTWPVLKAEPLARIWLEYGRRGTVRDEEGVARIADQVMRLIARLYASTELSGHTVHDDRPEAEEHFGRAFTDEEWDRLLDMLEDAKGNYLLSDYAIAPLQAVYRRLHAAKTPEEQVQWDDRALNNVHQRSDLASLFVQGGTRTLDRIAAQGGFSTVQPEEGESSWEARIKAQREYTKEDAMPTTTPDFTAISHALARLHPFRGIQTQAENRMFLGRAKRMLLDKFNVPDYVVDEALEATWSPGPTLTWASPERLIRGLELVWDRRPW